MKLFLCSLALLLCVSNAAKQKRALKACGPRLIKMVSQLCKGCIASPLNGKPVRLIKKDPTNEETLTAMQKMALKDRQKRGIVEECCYSSCNYQDVIKNYCC